MFSMVKIKVKPYVTKSNRSINAQLLPLIPSGEICCFLLCGVVGLQLHAIQTETIQYRLKCALQGRDDNNFAVSEMVLEWLKTLGKQYHLLSVYMAVTFLEKSIEN